MANALQYPGQFEIEQILLITSKNEEVDLSASVVALTLYEDIFSLTVTGELLIQDSVNLASTGPIIGQEYLKLKLRTPTFQDKSAIIDFSEKSLISMKTFPLKAKPGTYSSQPSQPGRPSVQEP